MSWVKLARSAGLQILPVPQPRIHPVSPQHEANRLNRPGLPCELFSMSALLVCCFGQLHPMLSDLFNISSLVVGWGWVLEERVPTMVNPQERHNWIVALGRGSGFTLFPSLPSCCAAGCATATLKNPTPPTNEPGNQRRFRGSSVDDQRRQSNSIIAVITANNQNTVRSIFSSVVLWSLCLLPFPVLRRLIAKARTGPIALPAPEEAMPTAHRCSIIARRAPCLNCDGRLSCRLLSAVSLPSRFELGDS